MPVLDHAAKGSNHVTIFIWAGFIVLVFLLLALDLGILNRKDHVIGTREALAWTALWVTVAMLFNVAIYFMYEQHWLGIGHTLGHETGGRRAAIDFFTGYLLEKSLSLDNIFVIALIFNYFRVPLKYQHRVLFWGILGALIMRGAMIAMGAALIETFSWAVYLFGGFLIITAARMAVTSDEAPNLEENRLVMLATRLYPVTKDLRGHDFFAELDGKRAITPLFLVLLLVESSDVAFAVDSIPAIFGVTHDPFLVFTSNIFAILGLRSLYFVVAGLLDKFHYLKVSLVFILGFVGVKMILSHHVDIPSWISLVIIGDVLIIGTLASYIRASQEDSGEVQPAEDDVDDEDDDDEDDYRDDEEDEEDDEDGEEDDEDGEEVEEVDAEPVNDSWTLTSRIYCPTS